MPSEGSCSSGATVLPWTWEKHQGIEEGFSKYAERGPCEDILGQGTALDLVYFRVQGRPLQTNSSTMQSSFKNLIRPVWVRYQGPLLLDRKKIRHQATGRVVPALAWLFNT